MTPEHDTDTESPREIIDALEAIDHPLAPRYADAIESALKVLAAAMRKGRALVTAVAASSDDDSIDVEVDE